MMFLDRFRKAPPQPEPQPERKPYVRKERRIAAPAVRQYRPQEFIPEGRIHIERAPGEVDPHSYSEISKALKRAIRANNNKERGWEHDGWY